MTLEQLKDALKLVDNAIKRRKEDMKYLLIQKKSYKLWIKNTKKKEKDNEKIKHANKKTTETQR